MFKKILLSFAVLGFLFGSPLLTNASSFTSLKSQLFELTQRIESFNTELLGQAQGANSSYEIKFTASATQVVSGDKINLEFTSWYATSCSKSSTPNNSSWNNGVIHYPTSNSVVVGGGSYGLPVYENTTFSVSCNYPGGITKTAQVTVTVSYPLYFNASPNQIAAGEGTQLEWDFSTAKSCTKLSVPEHIQWQSTHIFATKKGVLGVANITKTTTFSITCTWPSGFTKTASATVSVADSTPVIIFTATPSEIPFLGSTTLNWEVRNMPLFLLPSNACKGSGDWSGDKPILGSQVISGIKYDKTFVLECKNPNTGKKASATAKVKVKGNVDEPVPQEPTPWPNENFASNTSSCNFVFNKNLSYGSLDSKTSKDVSLMQSILVDEGFLTSKDATGKFYNVTKTALIKFQKKHNIKQTGIADANTRVKLNELYKTYCAN